MTTKRKVAEQANEIRASVGLRDGYLNRSKGHAVRPAVGLRFINHEGATPLESCARNKPDMEADPKWLR
jgi:hypothetical protein